MGFTDVFFCPLLANDLAIILLKMLNKGLRGLYHVVSRDCASKYEFGIRLAQRFNLNQRLIIPVSVEQASLPAPRSPNLILIPEKLTRDLGEPPPNMDTGLDKFHGQFVEGYQEKIRRMALNQPGE
jgi:dTDP-4-dehydrorhamnose reductase